MTDSARELLREARDILNLFVQQSRLAGAMEENKAIRDAYQNRESASEQRALAAESALSKKMLAMAEMTEALSRADAFTAELQGALSKEREDARRMRQALRIIAGREQCIDNLMSNADIADAALSADGAGEDK